MPGQRGPVPVPLKDSSRDITQEVLELLDQKPKVETSNDFADLTQAGIKAALDRLASRQMVQYTTRDTEQLSLTREGETICDEGSHEFKVWDAVRRNKTLEIKDLQVSVNDAAFSSGFNMGIASSDPLPNPCRKKSESPPK